jgi:hypothetical protein
MSGSQNPPRGLAKAQQHIIDLLDDLNETVESARRLDRIGQHGIAVRLIDEQRERLSVFVRDVAAAAAPMPWFLRVRRSLLASAFSAFLLLAGGTAFVLTRAGGNADIATRLSRAERIADPAARLSNLKNVYAAAYRSGATSEAGVRRAIADAARNTREDLRRKHRNDGRARSLLQEADLLAVTADHGDAPTAPPPHSSGESPIDTAKHTLRSR